MTVTAVAPGKTEAGAEEPAKKGKLKLVLVVVVLLALLGGAVYWFMFKPHPKTAPKPGLVVKLDPLQVNLAGEHYLRVGLALQLVAGVKEEDGSKALDAAIDEFSGQQIATISEPGKRRAMKAELEKKLKKLYDGEVMGVYYTDFVTQ